MRDRTDGEIKAVKLLKPNSLVGTTLGRFQREFRVISNIDHRNIVRVYDFGMHDGGQPYFSMELLPGSDLGAWREAFRPVEGQDGYEAFAGNVAYIFHQVADALATVHRAEIIHRDLKPENIFVRPGRHPRAKLLDFGHARDNEGENLTQTGTVLGTASYIAPEQAMGRTPAPPADLYGLGCVLYQTLTGSQPFTGTSVVQVLMGHIQKPPPDPRAADPRVPDQIADLCLQLMAKDPAERPGGAQEVADLLVAM